MSLIKNAFNKLKYKAFQASYDPEAEKYAQEQARASESPNVRAWNEYKAEWSRRAVASGKINPQFYDSYRSIMSIPAPPDKETEYNAGAASLAAAIRTWFVNAKYSGDLASLAQQIEATKPVYVGPAVTDSNGRPVAAKPPPKPKTTTQLFITGFLSTFFSIFAFVIIFFLCILAGTFAANDAIGRSATIRIVYFLYAAFPLFTPFVLGYYIYRYIKGTAPLYYNMLPLTTSPGSSMLIQLLKWPFYYVPDKNSQFQAEEIIRMGKALVFGGGSVMVNKPAPSAPLANNVVNKPVPSAPLANNVVNKPVPSAPLANNTPAPSAPLANNVVNKPVPSAPLANNAPRLSVPLANNLNNNPINPSAATQPKPSTNAQL